jgi:hypothetical protein
VLFSASCEFRFRQQNQFSLTKTHLGGLPAHYSPIAKTFAKTISETTAAPSAKNGSKQDSERIDACYRAPKNSTPMAQDSSCGLRYFTNTGFSLRAPSPSKPTWYSLARHPNVLYPTEAMCAKLNHGESQPVHPGSSSHQPNILALSAVRRQARPRLRNHLRRFFRRSPRPHQSRRPRRQNQQTRIAADRPD